MQVGTGSVVRRGATALVAVVAVLAGLVATASPAPAAAGQDVLVVRADNSFSADVVSKLDPSFDAVDSFNAVAGTPTLAQLQGYDAVLVYSDNGFANSTALGNVLADYVDGGGRVAIATFALFDSCDSLGMSGRIVTGGYLPFNLVCGQTSGATRTLVADLSGHPLLAGVTSFNGGTASYHNPVTLAAGATLVAHWDNGVPLVGYKAGVGAGSVVGLNFYPPSKDIRGDFWDTATDGRQLLVNALEAGVVSAPPQDDSIVTVAATTATATEGGEPGEITFTRTGDRFRTMLVRYSVTGTATSGTDFEALAGTVQFPYGATTVTVPVAALADEVVEQAETVVVNVEFGEYTRRAPMSATVTIQDAVTAEPVCEGVADAGFTDVPDGYVHADNIDCIAAYGLAEGYPDGTYRFRDNVKRGQMASFVSRLLDAAGVALPASPADAFTADDGGVHERSINQLAALGIFDGTTGEDGEMFHPWDFMRRDDMAQILVNAYKVVTGDELEAGEDAFTDDEGTDADGTGTDNEDAINALAAVDVVEGTGGGLYDPDGFVTRGQFASFFARYMQVLADAGTTFERV